MFNSTRTNLLTENLATFITNNNIIKIKELFTSDNINNPLRSLGGYNVLQYTSLINNKSNILKILIDLGANPFIRYNNVPLIEIAHHSNLTCISEFLGDVKNTQIIKLTEDKNKLTYDNNQLTDDKNHLTVRLRISSDIVDSGNDKIKLLQVEKKDLVNKLTIEANAHSHEHILLIEKINDNKLLKNNNDGLLLVIDRKKRKIEDITIELDTFMKNYDNLTRKYNETNKALDILIKKQKKN